MIEVQAADIGEVQAAPPTPSWPESRRAVFGQELSVKQMDGARVALAAGISMEGLFKKISKTILPVGSGTWSHKATCPFHKQGSERTPSCAFSESEKRFHCFGCDLSGDPFDVMAMLMGRPAEFVIDDFVSKNGFSLEGLELEKVGARADQVRVFHKISITLRDYLKGWVGKEKYGAECEWVDRVFKQVDERFGRIEQDDVATAQKVLNQVVMDLERRKSSGGLG